MQKDEIILFDEAGEESEDELKVDLSKFNQAVIWGTDWTTETIASQLKKGNIDLNPSFQRRDAWSEQEKSRLIESLMLGIPVPPIILAENKEKKNSYIVIDGKQRLLSIRRFYSLISDQEFKEKNYLEKDTFRQLKLRGLEILTEIDGYTRNEVDTIKREYIDNLDNQSIRTIVIRNWPDEAFLYTVFLRLNTGSKKLSPQELRQALKPGDFLSFLDDATATSDVFKQMLNNKSADPRMKDIELALRYFAFKNYPEIYRGNLKEFLDTTCERLNKLWSVNCDSITSSFSELEAAISVAVEIFTPKSPFSRYTNGKCNDRFNRSVFELFSYYFSNAELRKAVIEDKVEFKKAFVELNDSPEFVLSVGSATKDVNKVVTRFSLFAKMLMALPTLKKENIAVPVFELLKGMITVTAINR
ncbi:MAG: DUF262 domain-containing protein [Clostridiales bacterium]|jgi:hypothetical protein|nr:DUF262 domain-containing protein [Clostridiales bacterium]